MARLHARVAHALDEGGAVAPLVGPEERVAELARHWLAAGPSYAGRAWRAAVDAAAQARRTFSWVEAEHLMAAAIEAHRRDPLGTPEERIDLLLTRARDCRPNAEWNQVLPCAAEAMALARRAGDLDRLAAAAAAASDNLVWLSQQWDEVLEDTVDDLRWGLDHVPPGDSPQRCRLMLALAVQLYYEPSARAEIIALADEGHAMARRIDDPALRWWACHTAWKALWAPTHLERRLELGREGLEAARASGDEDSLAIAHLLVAAASLEAGDRAASWSTAGSRSALARRRRNSYALMALGWVHMSLAAMSGDDEAALRHLARRRGVPAAAEPADGDGAGRRGAADREPLERPHQRHGGAARGGRRHRARRHEPRDRDPGPGPRRPGRHAAHGAGRTRRATPSRPGPRPTPGADRPRRRPWPGTRPSPRRSPVTSRPCRAACR